MWIYEYHSNKGAIKYAWESTMENNTHVSV